MFILVLTSSVNPEIGKVTQYNLGVFLVRAQKALKKPQNSEFKGFLLQANLQHKP